MNAVRKSVSYPELKVFMSPSIELLTPRRKETAVYDENMPPSPPKLSPTPAQEPVLPFTPSKHSTTLNESVSPWNSLSNAPIGNNLNNTILEALKALQDTSPDERVKVSHVVNDSEMKIDIDFGVNEVMSPPEQDNLFQNIHKPEGQADNIEAAIQSESEADEIKSIQRDELPSPRSTTSHASDSISVKFGIALPEISFEASLIEGSFDSKVEKEEKLYLKLKSSELVIKKRRKLFRNKKALTSLPFASTTLVREEMSNIFTLEFSGKVFQVKLMEKADDFQKLFARFKTNVAQSEDDHKEIGHQWLGNRSTTSSAPSKESYKQPLVQNGSHGPFPMQKFATVAMFGKKKKPSKLTTHIITSDE